MRLSPILVAAVGLVAAAAAETDPGVLEDEFRVYLRQLTFTNPGPENRTVDFSESHSIMWDLPANNTFPANATRYNDMALGARLYLSYMFRDHSDNPKKDDSMIGPDSVSVFLSTAWFTTGGTPDYAWSAQRLAGKSEDESLLSEILDQLRDRSGWDSVGDLPGGERFSFLAELKPSYGEGGEESENDAFEIIRSSLFDIKGVPGYTPGQKGAEWSGAAALSARPAAMIAGVVAAVALLVSVGV